MAVAMNSCFVAAAFHGIEGLTRNVSADGESMHRAFGIAMVVNGEMLDGSIVPENEVAGDPAMAVGEIGRSAEFIEHLQ